MSDESTINGFQKVHTKYIYIVTRLYIIYKMRHKLANHYNKRRNIIFVWQKPHNSITSFQNKTLRGGSKEKKLKDNKETSYERNKTSASSNIQDNEVFENEIRAWAQKSGNISSANNDKRRPKNIFFSR